MTALLPQLLAEAGLEATPRSADPALWTRTAAALPYLPVAYSAAMIDYQLAYFRGAGQAIEDASLILHHDHRPCGLWPLSFVTGTPGRIGSNGGAVLPPLFAAALAEKSQKKLGAAWPSPRPPRWAMATGKRSVPSPIAWGSTTGTKPRCAAGRRAR